MPEDTQRATRLRPEEILAQSFAHPLTHETNGGDGWSPRARRLFLIGLAVAGAILVIAGLLATGELAPGTESPSPLQTGADAGALGGSLLPPNVTVPGETPPATPAPSATPTNTPRPRNAAPVLPLPAADGTAAPQTTATTVASALPQPQEQAEQPATQGVPTTTVPCNLLGSRALGSQLPPLCR